MQPWPGHVTQVTRFMTRLKETGCNSELEWALSQACPLPCPAKSLFCPVTQFRQGSGDHQVTSDRGHVCWV